MGINDEYSRDAYIYDLAYDSDDSSETPDHLHPEDWQDWYSEDLLDAWGKIREYTSSNYIRFNATYAEFVEFIMYPGQDILYSPPTMTEIDLWSLASSVPLVREHVSEDNFHCWVRKNIERNCNV